MKLEESGEKGLRAALQDRRVRDDQEGRLSVNRERGMNVQE